MGAFGAAGPERGGGSRQSPSGRAWRDAGPRRTTRARRAARPAGRALEASRALPREGAWTPDRDLDAAVLTAMGPQSSDRLVAMRDRRCRAGVIEHLVVAPSGVWVISPIAAKGKVEIARGGVEAPRLDIAGVDRSEAIVRLAHQVAQVNAAMVDVEAAALVRGALCLVTPKGLSAAPRPLGGAIRVGDIAVLGAADLATQLAADGLLSAMDRTRIARALAHRLPPA